MKPRQLQPGLRVLLRPNHRGEDMGKQLPATVVAHDRHAVRSGSVMTVLHVDAYAGLNGPDDKGVVHLSRHQVIHLLVAMGRHGGPVTD